MFHGKGRPSQQQVNTSSGGVEAAGDARMGSTTTVPETVYSILVVAEDDDVSHKCGPSGSRAGALRYVNGTA